MAKEQTESRNHVGAPRSEDEVDFVRALEVLPPATWQHRKRESGSYEAFAMGETLYHSGDGLPVMTWHVRHWTDEDSEEPTYWTLTAPLTALSKVLDVVELAWKKAAMASALDAYLYG